MTADDAKKPFRWLNPERLAIASIAYFVLFVTVYTVLKFTGNQGSVAIFASFWESGRAANAGENPFLNYPGVWTPPKLPVEVHETNLNSPAALPLFQLFALFPKAVGAGLWSIVSAVLHLYCVYRISRLEQPSFYQLAWLVICPIVLTGIAIGQIYALMFALAAGAWLFLKADRPVLAGLLMGVFIALKPNFGMWCLAMVLAGYWRPAVVAGFVAAALTALPVLLYGPDIYSQWQAAVALDNHGLVFAHDVSLHGYFTRLGVPVAAVLAPVLVGIAGLAFIWWRKPDWPHAHSIGILLGILCSPLAWLDYVFFLAPALVSRRWERPMFTASFITFLPGSMILFALGKPLWLVIVGTVYLGVMLLVAWTLFSWALEEGGARSSPAPAEAAEA